MTDLIWPKNTAAAGDIITLRFPGKPVRRIPRLYRSPLLVPRPIAQEAAAWADSLATVNHVYSHSPRRLYKRFTDAQSRTWEAWFRCGFLRLMRVGGRGPILDYDLVRGTFGMVYCQNFYVPSLGKHRGGVVSRNNAKSLAALYDAQRWT